MNRRVLISVSLVTGLLLTGCISKPEEVPSQPEIQAEQVEYTAAETTESIEFVTEDSSPVVDSDEEFNAGGLEGTDEKWFYDRTLSNEDEAAELINSYFGTPKDAVSLEYESSDSNNAETWYDFHECYNGIPVRANALRVHSWPDMVLIQGVLLDRTFEEADKLLSKEQLLKDYIEKKESEEYDSQQGLLTTDSLEFVELCYLNAGEGAVPLCYKYSNEVGEVFLNAVTGDVVYENSLIIWG